jgi:hypothetical protein
MQYLAYSAVVLIICLVAMRMFKPQIASLIDRTKKIGPTGLDASGIASQQLAVKSDSTVTEDLVLEQLPSESKSFEEFQKNMAPFRFPTMIRKAEELKSNLDLESLSADQLKEIATQVGAFLLMASEFENIYTLIVGSQINTLHDLNTVYAIGRPIATVKAFYDKAFAAAPEAYQAFSFEQWLHFLQSNNLIAVESGIAKISDEGRDFLRYLIQTGKPLNKAY